MQTQRRRQPEACSCPEKKGTYGKRRSNSVLPEAKKKLKVSTVPYSLQTHWFAVPTIGKQRTKLYTGHAGAEAQDQEPVRLTGPHPVKEEQLMYLTLE